MFSLTKTWATVSILTAPLAAAGLAMGAGQASVPSGPAPSGPVRCEIQVTPANGMIALAGVVHADIAVGGSYSFRVSGGGRGGSANISQGGPFAAGPSAAVTLGSVLVGSAGGNYDATLEVTANGATVLCRERIGRPIWPPFAPTTLKGSGTPGPFASRPGKTRPSD